MANELEPEMRTMLIAGAILSEYAENEDLEWTCVAENDDQEYFDSALTEAIIRYVNENCVTLNETFNDLRNTIRTDSDFDNYLVQKVAFCYCDNTYNPDQLIICLAWIAFLSFSFYEHGRKHYPELGLNVMADALCHYEKRGKMEQLGGYEGLYAIAATFLQDT